MITAAILRFRGKKKGGRPKGSGRNAELEAFGFYFVCIGVDKRTVDLNSDDLPIRSGRVPFPNMRLFHAGTILGIRVPRDVRHAF